MANFTRLEMLSLFAILFLFIQGSEAICEKVCSKQNHYRTEPAYHAQVSLRTPAALGKTKMAAENPKLFKRSSLITEFDLPATSDAGQQTVIVREGVV